jgi:hypothetical protein
LAFYFFQPSLRGFERFIMVGTEGRLTWVWAETVDGEVEDGLFDLAFVDLRHALR